MLNNTIPELTVITPPRNTKKKKHHPRCDPKVELEFFEPNPTAVFTASYGNWPCHNGLGQIFLGDFDAETFHPETMEFRTLRWGNIGKFCKRELHHWFLGFFVGNAVYGCSCVTFLKPLSQTPSS